MSLQQPILLSPQNTKNLAQSSLFLSSQSALFSALHKEQMRVHSEAVSAEANYTKASYIFALDKQHLRVSVEADRRDTAKGSRVRHPSNMLDWGRFIHNVTSQLEGSSQRELALSLIKRLGIEPTKKIPYEVQSEEDDHSVTFFDSVGKTHLSIELYPAP